MNEEGAKKIPHVLAQLKARKEILLAQSNKVDSKPSPTHTSKLDQVSENHVKEALKKWGHKSQRRQE